MSHLELCLLLYIGLNHEPGYSEDLSNCLQNSLSKGISEDGRMKGLGWPVFLKGFQYYQLPDFSCITYHQNCLQVIFLRYQNCSQEVFQYDHLPEISCITYHQNCLQEVFLRYQNCSQEIFPQEFLAPPEISCITYHQNSQIFFIFQNRILFLNVPLGR